MQILDSVGESSVGREEKVGSFAFLVLGTERMKKIARTSNHHELITQGQGCRGAENLRRLSHACLSSLMGGGEGEA